MAIGNISAGDTSSIAKINEAIDRVNVFEDSKVDNSIPTGRVLGRSTAGTGAVSALTVTGGLEAASSTLRIADNGVTTAKVASKAITNNELADAATQTFKGRLAAGSGPVSDLTVSQMKTALGISALEAGLSDEVSARTNAVNAEATTRANADAAESQARINGDTAETQARAIAVNNLQGQINLRATKSDLAEEAGARQAGDEAEATMRVAADELRPTFSKVSGAIRPGEAPSFFTAEVDGEPDTLEPLSSADVAASTDGKVAKIDGAGVVAPVAVWRIEPGHLYRVRFVLRRAVDTDDPANDAIRLGVRWLKSDKSGSATAALANLLDVTVADGRVEYVFTLATVSGDDVDAVSPPDGVYFRPFVRAFGSGETYVEVIQVVDATDAVVWSPDVELLMREIASLTAQVISLNDRVSSLEA
ncbi:hypothetical protein GB928_004185 [Shinella curvata]|uniref:Endosialidase-like protein n=1 Tax=Shinella curvata TaxID=1817964 RepID=A0ABT8X9F9_9HYPH|nr:hypothetical protein [Shinella curvata]MCJ8051679.1 hypothetical protein [Shinella curvata]MDO6120374.1 hypothetical protein [Shinella curvata]